MDAHKIAKSVIRTLVSSGASAAGANIVHRNRNTSKYAVVDTYHQTAAYAGGAVVGWMVGDYMADFAEKKYDDAVASFKEFVKDLKK